MGRKKQRQVQLELPFTPGRGGVREGQGRKRALGEDGKPLNLDEMPHVARGPFVARYPVHVTVKLLPGLPSLRNKRTYKSLLRCFVRGRDRFGFRLNHYSVQSNHLHLIVEADNREAMTRGMKGLLVRVAKALNKLWGRRGKVTRERFHESILKSPTQVRNAIAYVLKNSRRHRVRLKDPFDPYSSCKAFKGWKETWIFPTHEEGAPPVVPPRTWMLREGWARVGKISYSKIPGPIHNGR